MKREGRFGSLLSAAFSAGLLDAAPCSEGRTLGLSVFSLLYATAERVLVWWGKRDQRGQVL